MSAGSGCFARLRRDAELFREQFENPGGAERNGAGGKVERSELSVKQRAIFEPVCVERFRIGQDHVKHADRCVALP